jgi:hypothetical protein
MPTDLQRQQALDAAYDALASQIPSPTLREQAAETIVTELDGKAIEWVLAAGIVRRSNSLSAYATLEAAYGLDRSTVDAAVVAAANRLGTQY